MSKPGTAVCNANGVCPVVALHEHNDYAHVTFWHKKAPRYGLWEGPGLIIQSKIMTENTLDEIQDILFNTEMVETIKLIENTITDKQWSEYLTYQTKPFLVEDQMAIDVRKNYIASDRNLLLEVIDQDIVPLPSQKTVDNLLKAFENKAPAVIFATIAQTLAL